MKKYLLFFLVLGSASSVSAQKVDSIYFHLYTDSLKKGQHNYINVDGKTSNGRWLPLTSKDIIFSCPEASFEGNELVIPVDFKPEKVTIKAALKTNPQVVIVRTIWIKKKPDDEQLPTNEEVLKGKQPKRKN